MCSVQFLSSGMDWASVEYFTIVVILPSAEYSSLRHDSTVVTTVSPESVTIQFYLATILVI